MTTYSQNILALFSTELRIAAVYEKRAFEQIGLKGQNIL